MEMLSELGFSTLKYAKEILITYKNVIINNTTRYIYENGVLCSNKLIHDEIKKRYPTLKYDIKKVLKGNKYLFWGTYYKYLVAKHFSKIISLFVIYKNRRYRRKTQGL
jgi:hypothetical protein